MNLDLFIELSIILVVTFLVTSLMRLLKQPSIIAYLVSGILAGPFILDIVNSTDFFTVFAQKGVALLLFLVGLNLNPKVIKDVGKISLITGVGQVLFTTSLGFVIAKFIGFSTIVSLYLSFALAFSSTIVIMKLLADKNDLETLYGRISIGFLIVQDFIVILFLLIISSFKGGADFSAVALETVLKGLGALLLLFLMTVYVLPVMTKRIAKSQEFLFLFSLTWCFAVSSLFHYLNFSLEAGALLAGMALSISPYHFEISARMKPLRDFFLILFFVLMGSQMIFNNILQYIIEILSLSFFVLIGNPLIVMILMGLLGYTKRNSFRAGLTVAQISEFSLIIITMGVAAGHLSSEILSIITSIGLITFAGSTYMIIHSDKLYSFLAPSLSLFEKKGKKVDVHSHKKSDSHTVLLFGYDHLGFDVLKSLKKMRKKFLIIDYDPEIIKKLSLKGYPCRYGDASDAEILDQINFSKAKMVVSTIAHMDTNLFLISRIREENPLAIIAVVSNAVDNALKLYQKGATYVIMPHFLGGKHFSTMIEKNKLNMAEFLKEKVLHLKHIRKRKSLD